MFNNNFFNNIFYSLFGGKVDFIQWIANNQTILIVIGSIVVFWSIIYTLFGDKEEKENEGQELIKKEFKVDKEKEGIEEEKEEEELEEGLVVDFLVAMYRTKKLIGFIESLTNKAKRFWNIYFTVGIFVGIGGMFYVFYFLAKNAINVVSADGGTGQGVQLIIPGITTPLAAGLIGIMTVMFAHELSHGIAARTDKLNLKSVGLMLLVVIPGAFVEPNEEELKKSRLLTRLKVYAAGSFTNIVIGLIISMLLLPAISPVLAQPNGIQISGTIQGEGAEGILQSNDVIVSLNGEETLTYQKFQEVMSNTAPGEEIPVTVRRDGELIEESILLSENPNAEGGFLGVELGGNPQKYEQKFPLAINILIILNWMGLLNLGIGLMNLFPLLPLDGGKIVQDILKEYTNDKTSKIVTYALSVIGLGLILLNIFPGI